MSRLKNSPKPAKAVLTVVEGANTLTRCPTHPSCKVRVLREHEHSLCHCVNVSFRHHKACLSVGDGIRNTSVVC